MKIRTTVWLLTTMFFFTSSFLHAQTADKPAGEGTLANPYKISTLNNLYWLSQNSSSWGMVFEQTADIDASSTSTWAGGGFTPIGNTTTNFTGSYNGKGHTITGLYINRPDQYVGMFGFAGGADPSISSICNLGLININITGSNSAGDASTGGLTGCNNGSLTCCFTSGHVNAADNYAGGLAGFNGGYITNCYSSCAISGNAADQGGLIGTIANGEIEYCYSVGTVTGGSCEGGFVGLIDEWGTVGNTCFWDIETAGEIGCNTNTGGEFFAHGKTTSYMKTKTTFTDAGWDFTNTWELIPGYYPRLKNVADPTLPVELSAFTAVQENNNILLNWETATEINNYGFEIERTELRSSELRAMSSELKEYKKIGFVAGAGSSNSLNLYSFEDKTVAPGKYLYRLKQIDNDGTFKYYQEVAAEVTSMPDKMVLEQNYPNPFNPSTLIKYQLPEASNVTLKVYDMLGKEVATLVNEFQQAGSYNSHFDIQNSGLASSIYIARLTAGKYIRNIKMSLLK